MLGIGPWEMVIILLVALLVLGPRKLPEMMRTFGKLMAELRRTADEVRDEIMFDEDLKDIKRTVQDMQDLSTNAVEHLIKEGERELALEENEQERESELPGETGKDHGSEEYEGSEEFEGSGEEGEAETKEEDR